MAKFSSQCQVFLFLIWTILVHSLPHDICFEKFDEGDCNGPPKQVFYYYQKGSRCETKIWRGCPTLNKFDDEFSCSHLCIGKLWGEGAESASGENDTCLQQLNQADCSGELTEVFTYKNGICVKEDWFGCDTQNKFANEESCVKTCVNADDWVEQLGSLNIPEIKEIDTILDDVIEDPHVPLNFPDPAPEPEPLPDSSGEKPEGSYEEVVNLRQ